MDKAISANLAMVSTLLTFNSNTQAY